jgi:amphi-Trp domain-containing protein
MKQKMKTKMKTDLDKAISYIECLLDGLKTGTLIFEHNDGKMTLHPAGVVKLEIETEEEDGEQELEIELKWRTDTGGWTGTGADYNLSELLGRKFGPISE